MDWETGGHNIEDKKRKNNPSMGAREAGTQLSLSLSLFFSFDFCRPRAFLQPKHLSHLSCAATMRTMELLDIVITGVSLS